VVPPIAGGVAKFWVAKVPNATPLIWPVPVMFSVPENVSVPVKVWLVPRPAIVVLAPGKANTVPSVPENSSVLSIVSILPRATLMPLTAKQLTPDL
jgi:hypothetical protein